MGTHSCTHDTGMHPSAWTPTVMHTQCTCAPNLLHMYIDVFTTVMHNVDASLKLGQRYSKKVMVQPDNSRVLAGVGPK